MTASLSSALAEKAVLATAIVSTVPSIRCFTNCIIKLPLPKYSPPTGQAYTRFAHTRTKQRENAGSRSRDRDLDMGVEGGALAHAIVPCFEPRQWRPLDRESMPAVNQGPHYNLG